jgi:uncharacterized protein YqjF (DUF2071 family)
MSSSLATPRQRLTDVSSDMIGFAITTYDVAPAALARHLPPGIAPECFRLAGEERAFVSAVTFTNTNFYVGFAPFVRLSCAQTNYRAYVTRGDARAVWFFGTALDSIFVAMPRHLWGLPWHRARVRTAHALGEQLVYDWHAEAPGAEERLRLRGTGEPLAALPGFKDASETHEVLTHPTVGYLRRRDGSVATYGVWHAPLTMEVATPLEAPVQLFEDLGLIDDGQAPHSALVQRATRFLVFLPPRRVPDLV